MIRFNVFVIVFDRIQKIERMFEVKKGISGHISWLSWGSNINLKTLKTKTKHQPVGLDLVT